MLEWKTEYAVGIASIDSQQQKLFAIARELYEAMSAGRGKASLALILDRLVQYTSVHFAHEERLMRVYDYPDFLKHKAQHDALTKQVLAFQKEFEAGIAAMDVQPLQFLTDLLGNHIKAAGFLYAPFPQTKKRAS